MVIELILAEDVTEVAKSGDTIVLKDDNTFEIQKAKETTVEETKKSDIEKEFAGYKDFADCVAKNKDKGNPEAYCGSIKHKVEKTYDPRIEKYLPNDNTKAWEILTKFYKNNKYFDANEILKDFINKVATCPDVTDKFEKIMDGWMRDGEADLSPIEKIIDSCKTEYGFKPEKEAKSDEHVAKSIIDEVIKEQSPEQKRQMEEARRRQRNDDEVKIKPIGKSDESKREQELTSKLTNGKNLSNDEYNKVKSELNDIQTRRLKRDFPDNTTKKSKENPTVEERNEAHRIAREKAQQHEKDVTKEILDEVTKERKQSHNSRYGPPKIEKDSEPGMGGLSDPNSPQNTIRRRKKESQLEQRRKRYHELHYEGKT